MEPLDLNLDVSLGSGNFTQFVDRARPAFPATQLHFAGREQPLPVLIAPTVPPQQAAFIDISLESGNHVVYFSYDQSNLYLTAYKNRIDGPWYELTLAGVQIKPGSVHLMDGHYIKMQNMGGIKHNEMQFGHGKLENAVTFLSTRNPQAAFDKEERKQFLKQCAKNLLLCIAYTSEAMRFSIIATEIGGYLDNYVANKFVPHSPLLILAWDRISTTLIKAAEKENPADNFEFILDPQQDFPKLKNFEDCANAMGVLNPWKRN